MKNTIIMVAIIVTFLITWLLIATLAYLLTDIEDLKTAATTGGTLLFMFIFGWIPSVIVGIDLDNSYKYED